MIPLAMRFDAFATGAKRVDIATEWGIADVAELAVARNGSAG